MYGYQGKKSSSKPKQKSIENLDWLIENGHFYLLEAYDSEEIASFVHYFLSVTPYALKA